MLARRLLPARLARKKSVVDERPSGEVFIVRGDNIYTATYKVESGVMTLESAWGSLTTCVGGAYAAQARLLLSEIIAASED